jgi:iron complex transport system substrate-binding protein
MRICSLLPSATEILFALGLGDAVVGVTHECDYPAEAASRPVLVRPRVDASRSPAEIDKAVSEFVARGESLYCVDATLLHALEPDLIVTQELCHVCAASPDDLAAAVGGLRHRPQVLSLTPQSIADVWDDIRKVGDATGCEDRAEELINRFERRVAAVEAAVTGARERPRVLCLEWLDPPYVAGHWVPEMVTRARGEDVLGRPREPSFRVEWQQVIAAQMEVIVVMPCGYSLERAVRELETAKLPSDWEKLPAVQDGRVFAVDANSYFSRPGPRLADGLSLLAQLLHPELKLPGVPQSAARQLRRVQL